MRNVDEPELKTIKNSSKTGASKFPEQRQAHSHLLTFLIIHRTLNPVTVHSRIKTHCAIKVALVWPVPQYTIIGLDLRCREANVAV